MPASLPSAVPTQKQRFNVYTMMLILSFVAVTIGCVLLSMEIAAHANADPKQSYWGTHNTSAATFTPAPAVPLPTPPAPAPK